VRTDLLEVPCPDISGHEVCWADHTGYFANPNPCRCCPTCGSTCRVLTDLGHDVLDLLIRYAKVTDHTGLKARIVRK
jgi:hypothetical protein